ncbi:MAG: peroxiredoxin family protein [Muribaculaceae bacterium]|nr:peroxiredoxin family protein [Muribaculaceae bacterium]
MLLAALALACAVPAGAATPEQAQADSLRAAYMARELALNAPGKEAADFSMLMPDGSERRLQDFRGAPLLLVMFDCECDECLHALKALSEAKPAGLAALAVYAEGEEDLWPTAISVAPDGWQVGFDPEGVYSLGIYTPEFTPGVYLLDASGQVTARGLEEVIAKF